GVVFLADAWKGKPARAFRDNPKFANATFRTMLPQALGAALAVDLDDLKARAAALGARVDAAPGVNDNLNGSRPPEQHAAVDDKVDDRVDDTLSTAAKLNGSRPHFDHAMALEFYNAIKPNGLIVGYSDGRPVRDASEFARIAKDADDSGEHFFFAVARLKPE